jgi:hypothetical protein
MERVTKSVEFCQRFGIIRSEGHTIALAQIVLPVVAERSRQDAKTIGDALLPLRCRPKSSPRSAGDTASGLI